MRDNHFDQFVVAFKGVRSNTFHLPAASFHSMASLQLPPIPIRLSVLRCSDDAGCRCLGFDMPVLRTEAKRESSVGPVV